MREGAVVEINIKEEAPNVVTETRFKQLVNAGYLAEVICQDAVKKKAYWHGSWIIRVVNQNRTFGKYLVPARSGRGGAGADITIREFKTVNGLISFLNDCGFKQATIPLHSGGTATHVIHEDDDEIMR